LIEKIKFGTDRKYDLIDLTAELSKIASKMDAGTVLVFAPHATGAIIICEDEPGLKEDIITFVKDTFEKKGYKHDKIDNNAHAHIISSLMGCSTVLPVEEGKLVLGLWQSVFFLESDGPRERTVYVRPIT
jgi:secondary thiamine-phosphate synthase enzyme